MVSIMTGCTVTRPPQLNLTLKLNHQDTSSIDSFVEEVAVNLNMKFSSSEAAIPNADKSKQFEIYTNAISVFVVGVPDNKCVPNGQAHITFNDRVYRIDIVDKQGAQQGALVKIESEFAKVGKRRRATLVKGSETC